MILLNPSASCNLQKRVQQRGEHGGPKGEEPTRFGEKTKAQIVMNQCTRMYWSSAGHYLFGTLQGTGRRAEGVMTSEHASLQSSGAWVQT